MQNRNHSARQAILYGLFIGLVYALVGFNAFISLAALLLKLEYQLIHKLLWLACVCAVLTAALLSAASERNQLPPSRARCRCIRFPQFFCLWALQGSAPRSLY